MNSEKRTVSLPAHLVQRSPWLAALGILYALGLYFGLWAVVHQVFMAETLPLWQKGLLAFPCLVGAGYGMLLLGFMGHDGTHFTLHSNRVVSSVLGILLTAPIFPYMVMGFTISHWNHHKFTNSEDDPDSRLFSKFNTLFGRAFLARPFTFLEYGMNTLRLALGLPLPFAYQFPIDTRTVQRLAQLNVAATLACGAAYGWLLFIVPTAGVSLAAVYLFGTVISGLSPYIEHTSTDFGRGHDTRTASGLWLDIFTVGNNYHLEHHLYPTVPFYRLRAVHRHLMEQGYYTTEVHHTRGAFDTYRFAFGKHPYPLKRRA